jgi:manganese transport protein
VIVVSSLMALVIQTLSAKLGIATGKNLAELCRERFSRRTVIMLWLQAEAIAMATDLAECLGAAIGFSLLLGTGLLVSTCLTAVASFAILQLQSYGFRPFEAVIASLVGVIGCCYLTEMFYSRPDLGAVGKHAVIPEFHGSESVLLAVGPSGRP